MIINYSWDSNYKALKTTLIRRETFSLALSNELCQGRKSWKNVRSIYADINGKSLWTTARRLALINHLLRCNIFLCNTKGHSRERNNGNVKNEQSSQNFYFFACQKQMSCSTLENATGWSLTRGKFLWNGDYPPQAPLSWLSLIERKKSLEFVHFFKRRSQRELCTFTSIKKKSTPRRLIMIRRKEMDSFRRRLKTIEIIIEPCYVFFFS